MACTDEDRRRAAVARFRRRVETILGRPLARCRACDLCGEWARLRGEAAPATCPACGRDVTDRWHDVTEG